MDTEVCFRCDCPTGNAGKGDDSLYAPNGAGPYCHACFELVFELANLRAENERLSASESNWHHVADLRAIEIDRLRAENERLKRDVEHYAQAILWEGDMIVTQTRYEQVQARIAELEADVVWAVENGAREVRNEHRGKPGCRVIALAFDESNSTVDCDGTSADILRAVREARNGVS